MKYILIKKAEWREKFTDSYQQKGHRIYKYFVFDSFWLLHPNNIILFWIHSNCLWKLKKKNENIQEKI